MRKMKRSVAVLLLIAAVWTAAPVPVGAQGFTPVSPGDRAGTWEFYLPLYFTESATLKGQGGSSADINADWGSGFGVGYNFNAHFLVNGQFSWANRSYDALIVNSDGTTQRYSGIMDTSNFSANAVYYFLSGNITPFVTAGVGVSYMDTNIPKDPGTTCWNDPVLGNVCQPSPQTKTENELSYNAGIGVRYDIKQQFGLQFGLNRTWVDFTKAAVTPTFDTWRLDFIFRM